LTSELIGVRDTTEVFGISSEGSRVSGLSNFNGLTNFEATTWLSSSPGSGLGLGFGGSSSQRSIGIGAWSAGVVGGNGGAEDAFQWTSSSNSFQILPDAGGISEARDVSSNGVTSVGFSSDFGAVNGAAFWDNSGINQLDDPFGINSEANAISPNASFIGGQIDFFDPATFQTGTQAGIWSGVNLSDLTLLEELDASNNLIPLLGQVNDVSDSGWIIGETLDGRAFIDNRGLFDGINSPYLGAQDFDDWLLSETGLMLMTDSVSLFGISEDPFSGDLSFALSGENMLDGSSSPYIVTPEPSSGIVLFAAAIISLTNRRRTHVAR